MYTYNHTYIIFAWTKHNNITLIPDKTACTLFIPDPAEYTSNLDLKINNTTLPLATHPKVLGLTLDPKLSYNTHIHNISGHAHKPLQIIKHSPQQDGVNRRSHSCLPTLQSWDRLWSMPHPYGCCCVVVDRLPLPLLVGGVRCSRLWSTSQLLRPSGQQCSHSGGVCPQIQGWQCGAFVGAVEEMMCVVCVDVTEGA